ncbi:MAG: polyphenol oxidase family protein [Gemmatimonadetes bacterium]|nr:polyphenol oxidase family protein [Gemmatimonadota bacterium]NNF39252.1 laccase domain-containing protein [Gemmatimonadota bacterium]
MDPVAAPIGALVTEAPACDALPVYTHPMWRDRHPWLVQGITAAGDGDVPFNLGLFTDEAAHRVLERWRQLGAELGVASAVHARQPHEATVRHHGTGAPGLHLSEACDGHLTRVAGRLLGVTVADCVPVTLVCPDRRAVAVVHAGWRGAAKGIAEAALRAFEYRLDVGPSRLEAHLGPAICGACYEVGPEVHEGLGLPVPDRPEPVDLRRALAVRLVAAGVPASAVTRSSWCTRCGDSPFFSHRGGHAGRQVAFAGIRA